MWFRNPAKPTIGDLLSSFRRGSLLVVPPSNLERQSAAGLLAHPAVAGIVLRLADEELAAKYPGRVGWLNGSDSLTLPQTSADTFLSLLDWPFPNDLSKLVLIAAGLKIIGHCPSGSSAFSVEHLVPIKSRFRSEPLPAPPPSLRRDGAVRPLPSATDVEPNSEVYWRSALEPLRPLVAKPLLELGETPSNKIVFCLASLDAGGSERQAAYTIMGLRARRLDVSVYLSRYNLHEPYAQILRKVGVTPRLPPELDLLSLPARLLPLLNALNERACLADDHLIELIRYASLFIKLRPAVVHSWLDWPSVTAGLAAVVAGVPRVVLSGRSVNPQRFEIYQPFMRPCYEIALQSNRVTLLNNSAAGAKDYAKWIGTEKSIKVVRNAFEPSGMTATEGTSQELRTRLGIPQGAAVVSGLMRLSEEKRPELWVRIAAEIAREDATCHFVLAGGGPDAAKVKALVTDLGFAERTYLLGVASDPAAILGLSDCLLLTSRMEGLPNVLIEAQALGVPVVTSAVGGAPETLEQGITGWAVNGDEPRPYADAILRILRDADWSQRARARGPLLVRERFSMYRMLTETLAAYGDQTL